MKTAEALIVIDLQNGVCKTGIRIENLDTVVQGVNQRIAQYRKAKRPIIFVQHNDEELVAIPRRGN